MGVGNVGYFQKTFFFREEEYEEEYNVSEDRKHRTSLT